MAHYTKRTLALVAFVLGTTALACATSDTKTATGPGGSTSGGTPTKIVIASGDSQYTPYEATLAKPFVVRVTDSAGKVVTNTPIAWALNLDGASLTQSITFTNTTGETQLSPMMGGVPGAFTASAAIIDGQGVTFTGSSDVTLAPGLTHIVSGLFASCGLTKQGVAFCWGNGFGGQLGNNSLAIHTGPAPVSGGFTFQQIGISDFDTCGLTTDGVVYCWGDPTNGAFGNGAAPGGSLVLTPTVAAGGQHFSQVSVGDGAMCALSSGVAYCWGQNNVGQLGTGDTVHHWSPYPVDVPAGVSFAWIGTVGVFSCGLTASGVAYCWGSNYSDNLGIGSSSPPYSSLPVQVAGVHTFASLALGASGACGLTAAGAVYCWGSGVPGNGTTSNVPAPTEITQSGLTFTEVSASGQHACGLTTLGAAYCWGENFEGELGAGSFSQSIGTTPLAVVGGLTYNTVVAGADLSCGYTTTNVMYCWGSNSAQQLGLTAAQDTIAADTMYDAPVIIPGMTGGP